MTGCLHISEESTGHWFCHCCGPASFRSFQTKDHASVRGENQMIVYAESKIAEAVEKAKELRAQGISVSLIQMQEGRSKDDYLSYAMKDHVSKVEFIEEA